MYFDYIKEREGTESHITTEGFFTYEIGKGYILLKDMYVKPEYRDKRVARGFMTEVYKLAKEYNANLVITHVDTNTKGWELSKAMLEHEGYEVEKKLDDGFIYLIKEL